MNRLTDFRVTASRCWRLVVALFSEEEESVSVQRVGMRGLAGTKSHGS